MSCTGYSYCVVYNPGLVSAPSGTINVCVRARIYEGREKGEREIEDLYIHRKHLFGAGHIDRNIFLISVNLDNGA